MLWSIVTIGLFIGIGKLLKRLNMAFINPIIVTLGILVAGEYYTQTPYEIYSKETYWITYLLGPIVVMLSMIPKSITTPMAIEVTNMVGGMSGLTIISVIITGIIGASLAPWTLKLFKVEHPIAKGIGIGTSSHGIGTSKAVEMDEEVGAASGLAMGIAGVTTVLTFSIIAKFL